MAEHCGYIVKINELHPHGNADRLQIATIFGNSVIVGLDTKIGDMGVYFPVDLQLGEEYCQVNDLVRRKDENGKACGGYLEPGKRNIRAMRLRGEKSEGLFMPLTSLANFTTISDLKVGDQITMLNGVEICRKYIPNVKPRSGWHSHGQKAKTVDICPTFYQHVDTEQLAYHLDDFKAGDVVELTLKMHGTSGRTGHLPLRRVKRTWLDKIFHRPGKEYFEYGYVSGTRRVVMDETHDGGYYQNNDFRREVEKMFRDKLPRGMVAYYEIVGFTTDGTPIMASAPNSKLTDKEFTKLYGPETVFSYDCSPTGKVLEHYRDDEGNLVSIENDVPQFDVYVYRMTSVNEDGYVVELSPDQVRYECEKMGVKTVPMFERFVIPEDVNPGEYVVREVEKYFDGPDPIGKTHVREGVVARIVSSPNIKVYKHKNFSFKCLSNIAIDRASETGLINTMSEDQILEL